MLTPPGVLLQRSIPSVEIINSDCRFALELMASDSIDCVVTSPPYWGLRDYGVAGAIGLESSLAEHLAILVSIFREIRRVLKPTGTCWVNYGDAYACAPNGRSAADTKIAGNDDRTFRDKPLNTIGGALKAKDRMMLPARLALALQDDGWWLRDEIVWHKPNPMPSSVKDRTTPAHEMIYLLTKQPRYYFDQEAWKEKGNVPAGTKGAKGSVERSSMPGVNSRPPEYKIYDGFRNKRSVWTVAPKPFKEAHFATFPPALIEPCILAGCPEQVCDECGAPWKRVIENIYRGGDRMNRNLVSGTTRNELGGQKAWDNYVPTKTLGFEPTCECAADTKPGTVLDPFGGAGTTALVARQHGRNSILIELSPDYIAIARRRLAGETLPKGKDKQGALGKRQYSGFNERWKSRIAASTGIFA